MLFNMFYPVLLRGLVYTGSDNKTVSTDISIYIDRYIFISIHVYIDMYTYTYYDQSRLGSEATTLQMPDIRTQPLRKRMLTSSSNRALKRTRNLLASATQFALQK